MLLYQPSRGCPRNCERRVFFPEPLHLREGEESGPNDGLRRKPGDLPRNIHDNGRGDPVANVCGKPVLAAALAAARRSDFARITQGCNR